MIGLRRSASGSESNRSVHLYKLASQRTTKTLIRLCVSWITTQLILHLSLSTTKQKKNNTCAQRRLRTVWTSDSLIRVIVCCMGSKRPKLSSVGQRRLWLDWADGQADLSLRFVHRSFCCLVLRIILLLKHLRYS